MKIAARAFEFALLFWSIPYLVLISICALAGADLRSQPWHVQILPILVAALPFMAAFGYRVAKLKYQPAQSKPAKLEPCEICAANTGFAECECDSCCGCTCTCECGCQCHDEDDQGKDADDTAPDPKVTADAEEAEAVAVA